MRSILVGAFSLSLLYTPTIAQTFQEVGALGLTNVGGGDATWGDYDNDGNLDILLTGSGISKVYKNNGNGTFTDINAGLPSQSYSSAAWGDYDSDGDLDIALVGSASSKIYKNNGNTIFTETSIVLITLSYSSVNWGDFDNDGDLDLLITGSNGGSYSTIYRNDGNEIFTDLNAGLVGVYDGAAIWGDYDNDGDLDILLTGYNNTSPYYYSKLYKNNGNSTFTEVSIGLIGLQNSSVAWGDYDDDGYLDILLTGNNNSISPYYHSKIYKNNNGNTFTEVNAGLQGFQSSSATWADYDNDGDLDILLTGSNSTTPTYYAKIYNNNGAGVFTDKSNTLPLSGVNDSSVEWADYDADGDLDILITGYGSSGVSTKLFRNAVVSVPNTIPSVPSSLNQTTTASSVTLSWNNGTDTEIGREYNIYVRNENTDLIVSSMTKSLTDGKRLVQSSGNAGALKTKTIKLDSGTYYWGVQTIDRQGGASAWAVGSSFKIGDGLKPKPAIKSISRIMGNPGETLILSGDYFSADQLQNIIKIGNFTATVSQATRYRLVCTIPFGTPGTYNVSVQVGSKIGIYADNLFTIRGEYQWKKVSDSKTSKNLNSVFCTSPKEAWAAGADGALVATSDGGETWSDKSNPATIGTTSLFAIYFTHPDTGWVAGAGGKIFKTTNKGSTWSTQTSGVLKDITSIFFLSGKTGWVSGKQGTLLKTSDGGLTWSTMDAGFSGDINQIVFTDATRGWAACSGETTLYTLDKGATWTSLVLGTNNVSISQISSPVFLISNTSSNYYFNNSGNTNSWVSASLPSGISGLNYVTYLKPSRTFFTIGKAGASGTLSINTSVNPISSTYTPSGTTFPVLASDLNAIHSIDNWGLVCGNSGAIIIYKPYAKTITTPIFDKVDPSIAFPSAPFVNLYGAGFSDITKVKFNETEVEIADQKDYQLKLKTDNITAAISYTIWIKKGTQDWSSTFKTFSIVRFRKKDTSFQGVSYSASAWGDYDKDGDLDLLLTGSNNGYYAKLYTNNNGVFTENTNAGITGMDNTSVAWGDYDNDGDIDVLLTGNNSTGNQSKVFKNNGNGTFSPTISLSVLGLSSGSAEWGDYDNDGDLDILMTGYNNIQATAYSKVYKNGNGIFNEISASLPSSSEGYAAWGDYDNDGDLDIALVGWGSSSIYKNNGSDTFININASLLGVEYGSVAWGDYDKDGVLDLLLSGYQSTVPPNLFSKIYKNINGVMTDIGANLYGLRNGTTAWVDFDNDDDLDAILSGKDASSVSYTNLYQNNSGTFSPLNFSLPGKTDGSTSWGDYDNDGDLDLFLSGNNTSELYENLGTSAALPALPTLTYKLENGKIVFNWSVTSTTPANTTYNLRVGTTPGGSEILSPNALASGKLTVPQKGNMGFLKTWAYKPVAAGTFYFSVQSITTSLQSSSFSPEQSTPIKKTDVAISQDYTLKNKVLSISGGELMKLQMDFEFKISNIGFLSSQGLDIIVYQSSDNVFDPAVDKPLISDTLQTVKGISVRKKKLSFINEFAVSNYFLFIVIDPYKKSNEVNYASNSITIPLAIPKNDLHIETVNKSIWPKNKSIMPVKVVINHFGVQQSSSSKRVIIYRSTDINISENDIILYDTTFSKTLLNDSLVINKNLNLNAPLEYQDYFLITKISAVDDSNPTNDISSKKITISRADLAVKDIIIRGNAYQNATSLPITFTIKNYGSSIDGFSSTPTAEITYTNSPDPLSLRTVLKTISFKKLDYLDSVNIIETIQLPEISTGIGYFWITLTTTASFDDINSSNDQGRISKVIKTSDKDPQLKLTTAANTYTKGESIKLSLTIQDSIKIKTTTLYYRSLKKKREQKEIIISKNEDTRITFDFDPSGKDDLQGIYVWAVSENLSGRQGSSEELAIPFSREDDLTISIKGGTKASNYQIISFPRKHENDPLEDFTSQLGAQNKSLGIGEIQQWRLYTYTDKYQVYNKDFKGEVGKGYWVISRDAKEIQIKSGTSISSHKLKLINGWNLIGNPFDFDLDWKQALGSSKDISELYVFREGVSSKQSVLKSMEGAFVYYDKDSTSLTLNSFYSSGRQKNTSSDDLLWKVNFTLSKGDLTNSVSSAGMLQANETTLSPSMPHFIEYVDLVSQDFKINTTQEAASILVPSDTSYIWNYIVNSNIKSVLTKLSWSFEVPLDGYQLFIYDKEKETIINMLEKNSYSFESNSPHRVSVYYGSLAFIKEFLKPESVIIGHSSPNPHEGSIDLPLSVPTNMENGNLNCEVYDLMGRKIYGATYSVQSGFNTIHLTNVPSLETVALLKCTFIHPTANYQSIQKIKSR